MFSARRTLEAHDVQEKKPTCFRAGYKLMHTAVAGDIFIMNERFSRIKTLLGEEAVSSLSDKHVIVFGIGGVGGYAAEALVRSGIGKITLVDFDIVSESNINRQICALSSTIGLYKAQVMADRLRDINPEAKVFSEVKRYTKQTADYFFSMKADYIVDAIDCVTDKIDLICRAKADNIPIISAMGAGNKLNADGFHIADISKTKVCPLAKIMRKELGIRGIRHLTVVFSEEIPVVKERTPGSSVWAVGTAGLLIAGEVIKDLVKGV